VNFLHFGLGEDISSEFQIEDMHNQIDDTLDIVELAIDFKFKELD